MELALELGLELIRSHAERALHVDRLLDAACHGREVGGERDERVSARGEAQPLLDLRQVPVVGDTVRRKPVGNLAEERALLRRAACAGHARLRVDNDAVALDQPRLQERHQRQLRRSGVAAWVGDDARAGDLLTVHLGEPVHRLGLKLRCAVRHVVPSLVHLCVLEPEVGREVNHLDVGGHRGHYLMRHSVWQASEDDVNVLVRRLVHLDEGGQVVHVRELRVDFRILLARRALRGEESNLCLRVVRQ
mmetsp:Transcript_25951/g.67087  ORF Transcript_25951/g.67087 Transcript_25951/m.67087 type:complete len:248 (-) Transcript_25951:137-880(-)